MKIYTKNYLKAIGELGSENNVFMKCECCDNRASEIHHVLNKNRLTQLGLLNSKDDIENIMAICRSCHVGYGDINSYIPLLLEVHSNYMKSLNVEIDDTLINTLIKYYKTI